MRFPRSVSVALCMVVIFSLSSDGWSARHSPKGSLKRGLKKSYKISARSAILLDTTRQRQLYAKNIRKKVQPASTTKVMTALLVLERLPLDQIVTVSSRANNIQPSKLHLRSGEQYKVSDLLYAILLNSANDASIALAEAVAGSEEKFVALMNRRARQLGAHHTKFANSTGLPAPKVPLGPAPKGRPGPQKRISQYTTAYDMALIFRKALGHPFFKKTVGLRYKTIYSASGRKILLKNHNKLLFTDWGKNIHGKTGYTKAAQACFVGYTTKNGKIWIMALFGCSRRWDDIRYLVKEN